MSNDATGWIMLTAQGALHAFASKTPDDSATALQGLLSAGQSPTRQEWEAGPAAAQTGLFDHALAQGWLQPLRRAMQAPDTRLDDFVQHVIASLSGERRSVLASDSGFCLGRAGISQEEAESLSVAAADMSAYAARQARRGWSGASGYVSFTSDPTLLMPDTSFIPFWVDGAGYVLILQGEPLLNNPALVELLWGIKNAGLRFQAQAGL